mmetsp:Transcript_30770/g.100377  ORF Transcript_30770/g.100377 Transcript_30770/m.100377 type:complete len:182 (+) Transcript_30770:92-637(+)|eukprot:CAMPEP_0196770410 /NCGR_PEP_ID=MMETSP1104-20130614/1119_1 /TAXON_ID=33652 /ORGANISM="Cafeteria sp., Strain Caron Lab Isolate" /LENGTH=181 /DNA_ID=CAMNT_0042140523 /DNA_START=92 /DNA_END=637 /DNA_ORIENTATION=-
MAGVKRRSKYRKHVEEEALNGFPEPEEGDCIVQTTACRGGNIFEVRGPDGDEALALLPTKFKRLIWIKRGQYLIVSGASDDYETAAGDKGKLKYLIKNPLNREQVRHLQSVGKWPDAFQEGKRKKGGAAVAASGAAAMAGGAAESKGDDSSDAGEGSDSSLDELFQNRNRRPPSDSSDEED